jgi:membrane protease YdiL (CAAX protease family)
MAVLTVVLQVVAVLAIGRWMEEGRLQADVSWVTWLATFVPLYAVAVPAALLLMRPLPPEKGEIHKIRGKDLALFALMCFPVMYAGSVLGNLLALLLSGGVSKNPLTSYAADGGPIMVLVLVILAPAVEEFVFRKQIIDRGRAYGEKTAILFSAVTFALFHMNLYQMFYALGLGLLLAYLYLRTGRLRYSIGLHMAVNFLGMVAGPWAMSQAEPWPIIGGGYVFLILGLSVAGMVVWICKGRKLVFLPAARELPPEGCLRTVYGNPGVVLFAVFCAAMCALNLAG